MAEQFKYILSIDYSEAEKQLNEFVSKMTQQFTQLAQSIQQGLSTTLNGVKEQTRQMASELKKTMESATSARTSSGVRKLIEEQNQLRESLNSTQRAAQGVAQSLLGEVTNAIRMYNTQLKTVAAAFTQPVSNLRKVVNSLVGETQRAKDSFSGFFDQIRQAYSVTNLIKGAMASFGIVFGAYGIVQAFKQSAQAAAEFDKAMRQVWTLLKISEGEFQTFKDAVLELSRTVPLATSDLAMGIYWALSAGVPKENVIEFVEQAAKTAVAGLTSLKNAVDVITSAMNAYGYTVSEVTKITDILFRATSLAKTTFEDLVTTIGPTIPVAAELGVGLDELATAIGTLANMGISTARAATYINQALVNILSPSTQAKEIAEQLGLQFSATALQAMGFTNYLRYLKEVIGDNEEAMAKLFGNVRAMRAVFSLTSEQGLKLFNDMLKEVQNSAGATEVAARKMTDALSYQAQRFKNIWGSLIKSEEFRGFLAGLMSAVNTVSAAVTGFSEGSVKLTTVGNAIQRTLSDAAASANNLGEAMKKLEAAQKFATASSESLKTGYTNLQSAMTDFYHLLGVSYIQKNAYIDLSNEEKRVLQSLQSSYPALAESITLVGDAYTFNKEKVLAFLQAQIKAIEQQAKYLELMKLQRKQYISEMQLSEKEAEARLEEIQTRKQQIATTIELYKVLDSAVARASESLTQAMGAINVKTLDDLYKQLTKYWMDARTRLTPQQREAVNALARVYDTLTVQFFEQFFAELAKSDVFRSDRQLLQTLGEVREQLVKSARDAYKDTAGNVDVAWAIYKKTFNEIYKRYARFFESMPIEFQTILSEYVGSVIQPHKTFDKVLEAIERGEVSARGAISTLEKDRKLLDYQAQALKDQLEYARIAQQTNEDSIKLVDETIKLTREYVATLTQQMQEIAKRTPEETAVEGALKYIQSQLQAVLFKRAGLLSEVSRATQTTLEGFSQVTDQLLKGVRDKTLEEFAKQYSTRAEQLLEAFRQTETMLSSIDVQKLSKESRATYEQMLKLVRSEIEGLKHFVEVLDISDLVSKYSTREYRDIQTWLEKTYKQLFSDFGIDMAKLLSEVPKVALEPALDAFKARLRSEIERTKTFEPATALRIAENVSEGLAQYAQRLASDMGQMYRDAVKQIEKLPTVSERLRRLWETREQLPIDKATFIKTTSSILGPYFAELIAEQIFQPALETVQESMNAILRDSVKQGLNTLLVLEQAGIEKVAIESFIADLWAEYREKVENFQAQVRAKYSEVFRTETNDVKQALDKLLERAAQDEALRAWLQQLESLRAAIVQTASSLELLGEKTNVVEDLGGFLTGLTKDVRQLSSDFQKFEAVLGSFFATLDLTRQVGAVEVLEYLDKLRAMFDTLRNEAVRPLVSTLTSLYTSIYTGASSFEMFQSELAKIGITSEDALTRTLVILKQFSEATDLFANALMDVLRETSQLADRFKELQEVEGVSPDELFTTQRYSIRGLIELIESSEKSLTQYQGYYNQLLKTRDYLVQRYGELPEQLQAHLSGVVDTLSQLVDAVTSRVNEMATQLESAREQTIKILQQLWQGAQRLSEDAEAAVATGNLEKIIEVFNKLSKIDIATIPLDQVIEGVTGYQLRERISGALSYVTKALDAQIKQFTTAVKRKLEDVSIYKLAKQFLETLDWEGLSELITNSLTDPSVQVLANLIEKIEDAQVRDQYRAVVESLLETVAGSVQTTFEEVLSAISGGRFELIPEEDALRAIDILKAIDEQLQAIIETYDSAGKVADDFIEMQVRVRDRIKRLQESYEKETAEARKKQYAAEMESLEEYVENALKKLEESLGITIVGVKQVADELNAYVLQKSAELTEKFAEQEKDIASQTERLLKDIKKQSSQLMSEIVEDASQAIEDGFNLLEKMLQRLDLSNVVEYMQQLIDIREKIDVLKQQIETAGVAKEFRREIARLEEQYEKLKEVDLGRLFQADTIFESMLKLEQLLKLLVSEASLVQKLGLDLNKIYSDFADMLFSWIVSPASITQVFEQTILKPLNQAMVKAWIDAWREGIEKGKAEFEGLVGAIRALMEVIRRSPGEMLRYGAAVILTLSNNIIGMFEKLNVVSSEVANALRGAVEGAMAGWNIAGMLSRFVSSAFTAIFPVVGSILGLISSFITQRFARQVEEQERLRREIEAMRNSLASSFRSAIERAFSETDVESFAMRIRQSLYSAVRDALIRAFMDRYVAELIEPLVSMFLGPEGTWLDVSQIDWDAVRGQIESIAAVATQFFEYLRQILPELEIPTGKEWTPPSAVATITEETANRLVGLFTTLTVEVRTIRQMLERGVRVYIASSGAPVEEYFRRSQ